MKKDTKTMIFLWKSDQALSFTRFLNREFIPGAATLDGSRIEIDQVIVKSRMEDLLQKYTREDVDRRAPIAFDELTYRYPDAPFVDLYLYESPAKDAHRVTNAVEYAKGYVAPSLR